MPPGKIYLSIPGVGRIWPTVHADGVQKKKPVILQESPRRLKNISDNCDVPRVRTCRWRLYGHTDRHRSRDSPADVFRRGVPSSELGHMQPAPLR